MGRPMVVDSWYKQLNASHGLKRVRNSRVHMAKHALPIRGRRWRTPMRCRARPTTEGCYPPLPFSYDLRGRPVSLHNPARSFFLCWFMILLEVIDAELSPPPKAKYPDVTSQRSVVRRQEVGGGASAGPMPPDYDTSQAEFDDILPLKIRSRVRRKRRRLWRWVLIALAVYFVVSISIAIPLLIQVRPSLDSARSRLLKSILWT